MEIKKEGGAIEQSTGKKLLHQILMREFYNFFVETGLASVLFVYFNKMIVH
jgi:hypothetical protein